MSKFHQLIQEVAFSEMLQTKSKCDLAYMSCLANKYLPLELEA